MAVRITDEGESECHSVMERISVASATLTTSPNAKAGKLPFTVLHTRELDESAHEAKQMTTAQAVGAVSSEAAEWYANSLCVPPDGGRNTAHHALQRHRTPNGDLDLASD